MAFQWMSEPGMNTLLMNRVEERERGGASAMMYLVAFSAKRLRRSVQAPYCRTWATEW